MNYPAQPVKGKDRMRRKEGGLKKKKKKERIYAIYILLDQMAALGAWLAVDHTEFQVMMPAQTWQT